MKPVDQTKLHNPPINGNCANACFASILEINIEDVPCFEDMDENQCPPALSEWLESLGFYRIRFEEPIFFPGYYIVNGISPRGHLHSVVYKGPEMVHDPHPSRAGILKILGVWVLVPLDPARLRRSW